MKPFLGGFKLDLCYKCSYIFIMKTINKPMFKPVRTSKGEVVRFRIDLMRKKAWVEAMKKLGVKDFSSYARQAIDGAIDRDFRAKDPKWQAFIKAVAPVSKKFLGYQLIDNPSLRNQDLTETEKILFKRGQELAHSRGIKHNKPL